MKKRKKIREIENLKNFNESKSLKKTLIFSFVSCLVIVLIVTFVQLYGQSKILEACSYLDPAIIDYLAFFAALFLVVEGFARILEHPNASLKRQFTRVLRVVLGFAIITLHIIQFLHK